MDYIRLALHIERMLKTDPLNVEMCEDLYGVVEKIRDDMSDLDKAHEYNQRFRPYILKGLEESAKSGKLDVAERYDNLLYNSLCFGGSRYFDDYLQAVEYQKPLDKQFYLPRRHYLKPYVDAYQEIADGKLDFLSVSMPKRSGKSQMGINFVDFMSGRFPNKSTLMEGAGQDLVKSFYKGTMEYLDPKSEYSYYKIFPEAKIVETDAKLMTFNIDKKSRFPTVMCRSIDSNQVGLSEATNLLYLDDCVEGREEAINRNRLDFKWERLSGDILGRAIEGTPIVICGTRYSIYDPIGRLQEHMLRHNKRMKIIDIPALDLDTDESNFEYIRDGKRIFTTSYFREQRDMLNPEQFESEFQQQPIEARGLLFAKDKLNYYYELPVDRRPDAVISVCDTADTGGDSCSMPIAYIYGTEVYIEDVVFDDSTPQVTKPECANMLMKHHVVSCMFESNNAGSYFARDVQTLLDKQGYRCSIRTKRSLANKETRIEFASDGIIKNFYFKHHSLYSRNSQYARFIKELTTYTRIGKVPHDDAPDSVAMLENEIRTRVGVKPQYIDRPF